MTASQGGALTGAAAIVTGAGTGIGAALATRLAGQGAHVLVAYRSSAAAAEGVAEACRAAGGGGQAVRADVASDADCRSLVAALPDRPLAVLANNAGTTRPVPLGDLDALTDEDFHAAYDVNVVGAFRMVRAARARLDAGAAALGVPSAILNVSSIAGVTGRGSSVAYAASKAAMNGMTLSLARALAPSVRVNAVCPGFVDSGWWEKHADADRRAAIREGVAASTPLRAASTPDDIADAALPFCLPAFRHVTGETLLIDAGMHLDLGA